MKKSTAHGTASTSHTDDPGTLIMSILALAAAFQDRVESELEVVGLSRAKFSAMIALVDAGEPVALRILAERIHCVPSNITTLIDRMERDGFVRRINDPEDRRSKLAELTPLGRKRFEAGQEIIDRVQNEFTAGLTKSQRTTLGQVLPGLGFR